MALNNETEVSAPARASQKRRLIAGAMATSLVFVSFASGIAVGAFQLPPFQTLKGIWNSLPVNDQLSSGLWDEEETKQFDWEGDLLESAFEGHSTIKGELYYPAIVDVAGIRESNIRAFAETKGFDDASDNIDVIATEQVELEAGALPVVRVTYSYRQEIREAFSYGQMPSLCDGRRGSMVIPGSGDNQASAIYTGDPENYHSGILDALSDSPPDYRYIFIKQNHDFLAWHNGQGKKIAGDYIYTWHLNRGGSYSASYLLDALAFSKWMHGCFQETAILGLSQGGAATLLVSFQAKPTYGVVASGHSILFRMTLPAAANQIVGVPSYHELFREEVLIPKIKKSPTLWMFTWGVKESGVYGFEARGGPTFSTLAGLDNVVAEGHGRGHVFPQADVLKFMKRAG